MTQIKIEVPANDHIALSAMADALQRIATERAPSGELDEVFAQAKQTLSTINDMVEDGTLIRPEQDEQPVDDMLTDADAAFQALQREEFKTPDSAVDVEITRMDEELEQDDTLDADGIPHDKRIHSKGATRLADNTWRLRKRPADKTEEEWTAYIDSVKAELKAVQDIPKGVIDGSFEEYLDGCDKEEAKTMSVEPAPTRDIEVNIEFTPTLDEQVVADLTPPVTLTEEQAREEIKEKLESGEVTVEAPLTPPVIDEPAVQLEGVTPNGDVAIEPPVTAGAPVAPVTPPTSLTPPVAEAGKPSVTTFQELMLYMTSDAKKRGADNDMIKATLLEVDPALTAIPLIATRIDLIPKFVEALEAKLS